MQQSFFDRKQTKTREFRAIGHPGVGKTHYLSRQIERAADRYGGDNVIVSSFTKAASHELGGRNQEIPESRIATLHAHCYRAIGRHVKVAQSKEMIAQWNEYRNERMKVSSASVDAFVDGDIEAMYSMSHGDKTMAAYHILRNKMVDRRMWPQSVLAFAKEWEGFKKETDSIDFTDMIEIAYTDLDTAPGDPACGFFDEAQDFTPLEIACVRKWAKHMDTMVLVGDMNQSLYTFKGAVPEVVFNDDIDPEFVVTLNKSYRVPRQIQEHAANWISKAGIYVPANYEPRTDGNGDIVEGEIHRGPWQSNYNKPSQIIEFVKHMIWDEGKTVMIAATCAFMLTPTINMLRERGIPFHNPYRRNNGAWNPLATRKNANTVAERLAAFTRGMGSDQMWRKHDLWLWAEMLTADCFIRGGKKGISEYCDVEEDSDVEISAMVAFFTDETMQALFSDKLDVWWLYNNSLERYRKTMLYPVLIALQSGVEDLTNRPNVMVGTIHSFKGGECDTMILFPDLSMAGYIEYNRRNQRQNVEDEILSTGRDAVIRQFYVGMTRARHDLMMVEPATNLHAKIDRIDRIMFE